MVGFFSKALLEESKLVENTIKFEKAIIEYNPSTIDISVDRAEQVLNFSTGDVVDSVDVECIWNSDTKLLNLFIGEISNSVHEIKSYTYDQIKCNLIRLYDDRGRYLLAIVTGSFDDDPSDPTSDIKTLSAIKTLSQSKNLITIEFPKTTVATISSIKQDTDIDFLEKYGSIIGKNIYVTGNSESLITTKSFKSYYGIETDKDSNDSQYMNIYGNYVSEGYTYKIYKNFILFCAGCDLNCWIPTRFNINNAPIFIHKISGNKYGILKLYGRAEYDEYSVVDGKKILVKSGIDTLDKISGVVFNIIPKTLEQIKYGGPDCLIDRIDYKNNCLFLKELAGTVTPYTYDVINAKIYNSDNTVITSNDLRLYYDTRNSEWEVIPDSSTNVYKELMDDDSIADVYLIDKDKKSSIKFVIDSSFIEENILSIEYSDEDRFNKYFTLEATIKEKTTGDPGNVGKLITVKVTANNDNTDSYKWYPLDSNGEDSELCLCTITLKSYVYKFYVVQRPNVSGIKLLHYEPRGGYFCETDPSNFSIELKPSIGTSDYESDIFFVGTDDGDIPDIRKYWISCSDLADTECIIDANSYMDSKSDDSFTINYGQYSNTPDHEPIRVSTVSGSYISSGETIGSNYVIANDVFTVIDSGKYIDKVALNIPTTDASDNKVPKFWAITGEKSAEDPMSEDITDPSQKWDANVSDFIDVGDLSGGKLVYGIEEDIKDGKIAKEVSYYSKDKRIFRTDTSNYGIKVPIVGPNESLINSGKIKIASLDKSKEDQILNYEKLNLYPIIFKGKDLTPVGDITLYRTEENFVDDSGNVMFDDENIPWRIEVRLSRVTRPVVLQDTNYDYFYTCNADSILDTSKLTGGTVIYNKIYNEVSGIYFGKFTLDTELSSINDGAFKDRKIITSIVLPENIKTVGSNAFSGCDNLETITFTDVANLNNYILQNCNSLKEIICLSTTVPTITSDTFKDIPVDTKLKVRMDCVSLYKSVSLWYSEFGDRIEGIA